MLYCSHRVFMMVEARYAVIVIIFLHFMIRRPPRSTRTATLVPYSTLFRSMLHAVDHVVIRARDLDAAAADYSRLCGRAPSWRGVHPRSEEHTSELQSLMRISYAVFCLNKSQAHKNKPSYRSSAQSTSPSGTTTITDSQHV